MQPNPLSVLRQESKHLSSLSIPRRHHLPILFLRALCIVPTLFGLYQLVRATKHEPLRDSRGTEMLANTNLDYWTASLWCVLAGFWKWILTGNLMQQWLYHHELKNAVLRLVACVITIWALTALLLSQSNVEHHPIRAWLTIGLLLFGINLAKLRHASDGHHQKAEGQPSQPMDMRSPLVKLLAIPLAAVTAITMFISLSQMDTLLHTTSPLFRPVFQLDSQVQPDELIDGSLSIVVLIMSSWSSSSFKQRQMLRDTSLKLLQPSNATTSVTFRFVLGQPPSSRAQLRMGPKIERESAQYHDVLVVPSSDLEQDRSLKLLEALRWTKDVRFDYLVKTEDNVFARWDVITSELSALGQQSNYWRGLVYRNMPLEKLGVKEEDTGYGLKLLPAYTSDTLYLLSNDLVKLIVELDTPHMLTTSSELSLSLWLFGYNISLTQDARIQDDKVCEDNLIARRFGARELGKMELMYTNIVQGVSQCSGFDNSSCALCYPCHGKANDWRSANLACDRFKGVTQHQQSTFIKSAGANVKDTLEPSVIGTNDEWIIENVLSRRTSKFSDDDWHLVYWVCWTSGPATFTDRHWRALELVWVHEPRAVIFMISNTLPQNFFDDYTTQGYEIHIVHFNKENLLKWEWYFGPGTLDWLQDWDKWEKGKYFYWHITDYIRCLLLYNYGGTYMDMDALWIRIPQDPDLEFIGSDYSSVVSDREWTLDDQGLYLPQGLIRFKRGWSFFRELCESAFASYWYDPECFNCGGPKAITSYVREHRAPLEAAGFTILPREVLYPANYLEVHRLLLTDPLAEQQLRTKIIANSWNIHLFGKMTNHLPVQPGSLVDVVLKAFDLDIPHRDAKTNALISSTNSSVVPLKLIGPKMHVYRSLYSARLIAPDQNDQKAVLLKPAPGKFQGIDVIYVRGGPKIFDKVTITVEVAVGKIRMGVPSLEDAPMHSMTLEQASKKTVNALLNSLYYTPTIPDSPQMVADRMNVSIVYTSGAEEGQDKITIDILVVETDEKTS